MQQYEDYMSEFEQEFESDQLSDNEWENGYDLEDELEIETLDEKEFEESDDESGVYEYQETDNEFEFEGTLEARLYEVLNGEHESEFEFEQAINGVMYEIERDFFWKKAFKKIGSLAKKIKDNPVVRQLAKTAISQGLKFVPGGAALSALPIGDLVGAISKGPRKALRDGLAKQATGFVRSHLDGISHSLEGEIYPVSPRGQVRDFLNIAQKAYENLADEISKVDSAGSFNEAQRILKNAPKNAMKTALTQSKRASNDGRKRIIPISPNSSILVKRDRIIIWER